MVDDLLTVASCGFQSVDMNILINKEIEMKNLHLHTAINGKKSKCHRIHVGKEKSPCRELKVHGQEMEAVTFDSYLGDILSGDG